MCSCFLCGSLTAHGRVSSSPLARPPRCPEELGGVPYSHFLALKSDKAFYSFVILFTGWAYSKENLLQFLP